MQSRFKKTSLVAITAIVNNLLLTVFALVYNRLVIINYGSSVSGLLSTMNQFSSMFTVIEGGFSFSVIVAAYKPMLNKDYTELNNILYTAKYYLYRITIFYISLVLIAGVVYVYFLKSPLLFLHTFLLLILTTLTTALTIGGCTKYTVLLSGDNKQYITSILSAICKTITWAISIVLIIRKINILIVYSMNIITIVLNIFALKVYEKSKYPFIDFKGKYKFVKISGVKDMMFQKIAATVFTSTDLVLVSMGLSLSKASVYYIYNQIFQGVLQYLSSISSAPTDSFGHLLSAGEIESAKHIFLIYKKTINILSTIFFTAAAVMITPFLAIYSRNITDENYIVPGLALIFFSYNYFKINNMPYGMIINVSGNFKKQNVQTGIAAVINLLFSIVLMNYLGLSGIVLGSAIGTLIIISVNIFKAKEVFEFSVKKDILIVVLNYALGAIIIILSKRFLFEISDYFVWFVIAIIVVVVVALLVIAINCMIDLNNVRYCFNYYYGKLKPKR